MTFSLVGVWEQVEMGKEGFLLHMMEWREDLKYHQM